MMVSGSIDIRSYSRMIPIGDEYDDKRIMTEFSIRRSMKKERLGIEFDRRRLRENKKVKDVLPLAEQIMRIKVGIGGVPFRSV